jgi:polyhydroxyalkanoate synthesis repressor PhaR
LTGYDALRYDATVKVDGDSGAERIVKRYANRKLYDPRAGRYVTLDDLARMVGEGEELRIVDQASGDDLTTVVLAQVLLEGLKQRTARIPREVLLRLIRLGFGSLARWGRSLGPEVGLARARKEVERVVAGLIGRGKLTLDEAVALRQELARAVQRGVAEAQKALEARIHSLLERSERDDALGPALRSLRERLMSLETYLDSPAPRARGAVRTRGRRRAEPSGRGDEGRR